MKKLRILIADDHALFREGLRALLNAMSDIEMVGEAALAQVAIVQPDVILFLWTSTCLASMALRRLDIS